PCSQYSKRCCDVLSSPDSAKRCFCAAGNSCHPIVQTAIIKISDLKRKIRFQNLMTNWHKRASCPPLELAPRITIPAVTGFAIKANYFQRTTYGSSVNATASERGQNTAI